MLSSPALYVRELYTVSVPGRGPSASLAVAHRSGRAGGVPRPRGCRVPSPRPVPGAVFPPNSPPDRLRRDPVAEGLDARSSVRVDCQPQWRMFWRWPPIAITTLFFYLMLKRLCLVIKMD